MSDADAKIERVLRESRVVAIVGASPSPARDSHDVMAFLQSRGYRTVPVNPVCEETEILGEKAQISLFRFSIFSKITIVISKKPQIHGRGNRNKFSD